MAKQYLDVFLHDAHVGTISYAQGKMIFSYLEEYANTKDALPLSTSMEVQKEPFPNEVTESFFSGLLPEDIVRRRIARYLRISEDNTFALLKAIGGECAGAVSVYVPGESPSKQGKPKYRILKEQEAYEILSSLDKHPMMVSDGTIRISGAGAQDKLIVALKNGDLAIPIGNTPSTHIIKPEIKDLEGSVHNELFCMKLAKAMGLPVPECSIYYLKDKPNYLVRRFDRPLTEEGKIKRLHQEDFCQALHISPKDKYESDGGPTLQNCFELLEKHIAAGRMAGVNKITLLKGVIFNFLIGNGDAHSKNFSLLYKEQAVELAPFYDLMCTLYYHNAYKATMAMKLGGKYKFRDVAMRHFDKLAESIGFKPAFVRKEVLDMASKLPEKATKVAEELNSEEATASDVYADIVKIVLKQCGLVIEG